MHNVCSYQIAVGDRVGEDAFNAVSPIKIKVTCVDRGATILMVHADQAGLIGLLRYLHQQGFLILNVRREHR